MVLNSVTQETCNSNNGPNELNDNDSKYTLYDDTVSNSQSLNCEFTNYSTDDDESIPPNFNEIGPIQMHKLLKQKRDEGLAAITQNMTVKENFNHDYHRRSTLPDYTVSNRQSIICDHTDDSSDGDSSMPTSFNEIVPIEKQKLNLTKYNDQLVPLQKITKMTNNLDHKENHYDMTLLSSSESDDDSEDDEVQILCINKSNTSSLSKQVETNLGNESSAKCTPIADNTFTKTVKLES